MNEVRVNRKAARRVASGHPWIFESDVVDKEGAEPGAAVKVVNLAGKALGTAHFSAASQIALRMLSRDVEEIGREFFAQRLAAAEAHRRRVAPGVDAYRVVYGEGDLLPALVVDRYANYLVLQTLNQGMDAAREWIVASLVELFSPRGIVARNDAAVRAREALPLESGVIYGEVPDTVEFGMNGLRLRADLLHGQKTGAFLDQRENYTAAARYARGKALDCFTCTGGFALHLAPVCESVEALDSSGAALAVAGRNAALNGISNIEFREADVFVLLAAYSSARRQFQTVVLDQPAFAKSRSTLEAAAGSGRHSGYLFLFAASHRSGAARVSGASIAGCRSPVARARTPHAGPGSSDSVDRARDSLSEVPDPGSALRTGQCSYLDVTRPEVAGPRRASAAARRKLDPSAAGRMGRPQA
jgi:23S rRNA (cytosine1962-C5)-methyltransferase